jgi:hypothetical protein
LVELLPSIGPGILTDFTTRGIMRRMFPARRQTSRTESRFECTWHFNQYNPRPMATVSGGYCFNMTENEQAIFQSDPVAAVQLSNELNQKIYQSTVGGGTGAPTPDTISAPFARQVRNLRFRLTGTNYGTLLPPSIIGGQPEKPYIFVKLLEIPFSANSTGSQVRFGWQRAAMVFDALNSDDNFKLYDVASSDPFVIVPKSGLLGYTLNGRLFKPRPDWENVYLPHPAGSLKLIFDSLQTVSPVFIPRATTWSNEAGSGSAPTYDAFRGGEWIIHSQFGQATGSKQGFSEVTFSSITPPVDGDTFDSGGILFTWKDEGVASGPNEIPCIAYDEDEPEEVLAALEYAKNQFLIYMNAIVGFRYAAFVNGDNRIILMQKTSAHVIPTKTGEWSTIASGEIGSDVDWRPSLPAVNKTLGNISVDVHGNPAFGDFISMNRPDYMAIPLTESLDITEAIPQMSGPFVVQMFFDPFFTFKMPAPNDDAYAFTLRIDEA